MSFSLRRTWTLAFSVHDRSVARCGATSRFIHLSSGWVHLNPPAHSLHLWSFVGWSHEQWMQVAFFFFAQVGVVGKAEAFVA